VCACVCRIGGGVGVSACKKCVCVCVCVCVTACVCVCDCLCVCVCDCLYVHVYGDRIPVIVSVCSIVSITCVSIGFDVHKSSQCTLLKLYAKREREYERERKLSSSYE
jgi:hypothetical protein